MQAMPLPQQTTSVAEPDPPPPQVLRPEDIPRLRAATYTSRRALHQLARNALNDISLAGHENHVDKNIGERFPWQSYVACHADAFNIVASGVMLATFEFIESTRDPNHGGQPRLDLCFHRLDGTICRLHPGTKEKNDAAPKYILRRSDLPSSASGHAEHAPGDMPANPLTYEAAASIPQIDRISKQDAYQCSKTSQLARWPQPKQLHSNGGVLFAMWARYRATSLDQASRQPGSQTKGALVLNSLLYAKMIRIDSF